MNKVGFGAYSAETVVVADSVPHFMNTPKIVSLNDINPKSIRLTWDGITTDAETGGDPAIYYELQWLNNETNQWDILTTPETLPNLKYEFTFSR